MSTSVRSQPLASSVGALAAEHARLDRAKTKLEKEIAQMGATQTPTGDDLVRALAKEIAAEEAHVAAKRQALSRAAAALQTQARDREVEAAAACRERQAQRCSDLVAYEAARLTALGEA